MSLKVMLDSEEFVKKLFPNPLDALAVFLAFIVLLIVVFYVAYKPVKKLIQKRGDYVEGKIKNAESRELQAEQILLDANKEVKEKKIEAIEIVEKAKTDAMKEKDAILEVARKEKANEVEKAKLEIAQEVEASKDDIHREIVSVALDASKKVLQREVTSKDNEKLIDNFIQDLEENN